MTSRTPSEPSKAGDDAALADSPLGSGPTITAEMSDRSLDAWLAEHLFGMLVGSQPNRLGWGYVSTGDGMLLVLEAMRLRGWDCDLETYRAGYRVFFWPPSHVANDGVRVVSTVSLPRAVVEAAKAALEAAMSAAEMHGT